jgi:hypothetical protein
MSLAEVNEIMDSAPVRLYLQKFQDKTITELAKTKVRVMRKVGICKANIEKRLMDAKLRLESLKTPQERKVALAAEIKRLENILITGLPAGKSTAKVQVRAAQSALKWILDRKVAPSEMIIGK